MAGVLLPAGTSAGPPTTEGGGVVTAPAAMSLHGGPTAAPRSPAAPGTVHVLCGDQQGLLIPASRGLPGPTTSSPKDGSHSGRASNTQKHSGHQRGDARHRYGYCPVPELKSGARFSQWLPNVPVWHTHVHSVPDRTALALLGHGAHLQESNSSRYCSSALRRWRRLVTAHGTRRTRSMMEETCTHVRTHTHTHTHTSKQQHTHSTAWSQQRLRD